MLITTESVRLYAGENISHRNYREGNRLHRSNFIISCGENEQRSRPDGVKAKVFIRAKPYLAQGQKFLRLQQLKMDFTVRDIKMGVENVHDGNTILQAALNLFINSNSQELLKEMKPDLRRKLVQVMSTFVEKIFFQVPYDAFVID